MQGLIPWRRSSALRFPTDPFNLLTQFRTDLERMFDGSLDEATPRAAHPLPIEVTDSEGQLCVRAEVAGIEPDKLDIQLCGDVLTVSGEKLQERESKEGERTWSERRYGRFSRSVQLPCAVDAQSVSAEHKHGVVTITLRKADAVRTRRIEIKPS